MKMTTQLYEVAEGIYRFEVQIPGIFADLVVYFIKDGGGVLIEPGPPAIVPAIQTAVRDLGLDNLEYIIPTHIHIDHGGAVGKLSQLYPQAKVVVHPKGAKHIINPAELIKGTTIVFGEDFETHYGALLPVPELQVKVIQDGESVFAGDRELTIFHAPGHAPHHIAIFDSKVGGLFCGEALGISYTPESQPLPAVAAPSFDPEAYLSSIEHLRQLQPEVLFYSHCGIGHEPEQLIEAAARNTKMLTDAVLTILKTEKTSEEASRLVDEFIRSNFNLEMDRFWVDMIVSGYTVYFKKQGLV